MMNLRAAKNASEPNGCVWPTMAARKLHKRLRICSYLEELCKAIKKIHFHLPAVKEISVEKIIGIVVQVSYTNVVGTSERFRYYC